MLYRTSTRGRLALHLVLLLGAALLAASAQAQQAGAARARTRKVVFIAGKKSHAPGTHEYEKGLHLLARALETSPNATGYRTEVHTGGWPADPKTLDTADTIVMFSDGSDHQEADHPLLQGDRLETLGKAMKRGAGLVLLHYTVFAPRKRGGPELVDWVGGHFDYETGTAENHWYSKIQTAEATANPASPKHPISRGLKPLSLREEFYYHMRFREPDSRRTPILTVALPNEQGPQTVAWAVQRADGGRGFAFTGGHFHDNWSVEGVRKMVLNAIVWTAHGQVPRDGVRSTLPKEPPAPHPTIPLLVEGRWGQALNGAAGAVVAALGKPVYQKPPTTVECWARLNPKSKDRFNILVASETKESSTHWELYTTAGTGTFAVFLPGVEPSTIDSHVDIADGEWHHVALAYVARAVRLYVDATAAVEEPIAPREGGASIPGPLWFGGYPPQHLVCDGQIDDVRISNHARQFLRRPVAALRADDSVFGLWSFDALEDGHFADLSSQANPAVVQKPQGPPEVEVIGPSAPAWPVVDARASIDWPSVGNDPGGTRYSPLKQIDRETAQKLQVAWTFATGDAGEGASTTIECTPVVVEGVAYVTTPKLDIVALNAATGKEIWRVRTRAPGVNRGVAYWSDGRPGGARRILSSLPDGRLLSLDARTGRPDPAFGRDGLVDLRAGMERDLSRLTYGSSSAPALFQDLVILGMLSSEGQPGAPGDVRAFDVRTGKQVWRFHTVPRPGEFGNETWEGESWKERAGVNPWSGFTVDPKRGIVYCGTGSAAFDFYGGDRKGQNLFANCTLALDARTGKRIWHFQTLHHDIWDHDLPCPPVLVTVRQGGRRIDAAAQLTKTGYLFLFDRVSGKPLFPVEERTVPASDVPGEKTWPTQPFPVKPPPFSRQKIDLEDLTDISPEANAYARELFSSLRGGPSFAPPSLQGTVVIPGFHGGANWSGGAFDPVTGWLYFNSNNVPNVETLVPTGAKDGLTHTHKGYFRFLDKEGYPAVKPPWGNLNAVDLNAGTIAWQVPLGEFPELKARGVPQTGTETFGGAIVTAGGLVFIAGTKDEKLHAFDKTTGKLLWEAPLPAGGYATPSTYMVNGRQYLLIAAGGGGKLGTKSGDRYVAFALPAAGK